MKLFRRNPATLALRAVLVVGILLAALPASGVSAATYTLTIVSGNSQTASTNAAFANPLQVRVTTTVFGITVGVNGVTVTYTVPGSGASAVLSSSTATTASSGGRLGYASVTATANGTAGSYSVTAQVTGSNTSSSVSFNLTNVDIPYISAITLADPSPTNASTVHFNVAFTQPVSPVAASDFSLTTTGGESGASISGVTPTTGFNSAYVVSVATAVGAGTIRLDVPANTTILNGDNIPLGNSPYTSGPSYSIDRVAPTVVSITRADADPTELGTVSFTVKFSKVVSGVTAGAFSLATTGGQSGAAMSGSPLCTGTTTTSCTVFVTTGSGDGTLGLNLVASPGIQDNVGNPLAGPFTGEVYDVIKNLPVVVSINRSGSTPTNASSVDFTVTFSEGVSGVDPTDFVTTYDGSLSGTSVSSVSPVTDTVYTVTVNTGSGSGNLGLNLVDDDSIRDFAHPIAHYLGGFGKGNGNHTGDQAYVIDRVAPTVTVEQAAGQSDPTNASTINFTATFSQAIDTSTFAGGDVNLSGGTAPGTLSAAISEIAPNDGTTFNIAVSGMSGSGTVVASLDADVVTDLAGNGNTASTSTDNTVTYDTVAPAVTSILRHTPTSSTTNATDVTFEVTFSKDVQNVDTTDFSVALTGTATGALNTVTPVSASVYDVNINTVAGNGTLGLGFAAGNNIADMADNPLGASPSIGTDENYIIDTISIVVIDKGVLGLPAFLTILDGGSYTDHFTTLVVFFNKDAYNPNGDSDPEDVTNPANYLLLQAGPNKVFDTTSCANAANQVLPDVSPAIPPPNDDVQIPIGPVYYDNNGGAGPFAAVFYVNNDTPLPSGEYRLFICGTTSITDLAGNPLNGGADTIVTFHIYDPAPAAAKVPSTGFAPQRAATLPVQPASKAYTAMSDLWLEVPKLGVRMNILGVPQATDGTWDVSWLGNDAGWLSGSAYPTSNGNSVLTGHVYDANGQPGPFVHLNQLWWGDQVIVHAGGAQYVYEVRSVLQVSPQDVGAMMQHEQLPWLTLVTCRGYDEASNSYQYRVLVRAVLVAVK